MIITVQSFQGSICKNVLLSFVHSVRQQQAGVCGRKTVFYANSTERENLVFGIQMCE